MQYERQVKEITPMEKFSSVLAAIAAFVFSFIEAIVVALAISVVLYLFFMTPHEVVGTSMVPNFQNGENLIANKITYSLSDPKRGDVIIFKYSDTQDFIKRVIGEPGDTVSLRDGKLYVNDNQLDETEYLDPAVYTSGGSFLHEGESIVVPEGEYFAAGDNRPHSSDSREFGTITKNSIKGKAWMVYFPFDNFRFIANPEY
jgi:signal peptidase I